MLGDEPVDLFDRALDAARRTGDPLVADRPQELDAYRAAGRDAPVGPDEVP
jgi:hypothetical protein